MKQPAHPDPRYSPIAFLRAAGLSVRDVVVLSKFSETYVRQLIRGKERWIELTLSGATRKAIAQAVPLRDRAPVNAAYRLGRALKIEPGANPFLYDLPKRNCASEKVGEMPKAFALPANEGQGVNTLHSADIAKPGGRPGECSTRESAAIASPGNRADGPRECTETKRPGLS